MDTKSKVIQARRCLNRDTLDLPDVIRADIMNTIGSTAIHVYVDKDYENGMVTVKAELIDGRIKTYLYELYVEDLRFKYRKTLLEKRQFSDPDPDRRILLQFLKLKLMEVEHEKD